MRKQETIEKETVQWVKPFNLIRIIINNYSCSRVNHNSVKQLFYCKQWPRNPIGIELKFSIKNDYNAEEDPLAPAKQFE